MRKKIWLEMDAHLHAKLCKLAKKLGQSQGVLLEKALKHYLENVVPTQDTARPEVMEHFRKSTDKNRKLHGLLAK